MSNLDIKKLAQSITRDKRTLEMFRCLTENFFIRVVKYHNTLPGDAAHFEREIAAYSKYFSPVTMSDLDRFFETRKWHKEKPGLILSLCDGLRNQFDVMAPILENYGFCGWFQIPSFLVDVPAEEQVAASLAHDLADVQADLYPDGRCCMSWDEIRALSKNHMICCHTGNHVELTPATSAEEMRREIVEAKQVIEEHIDQRVAAFSWKSGGEFNDNLRAHRYLEDAGYRYIISGLKIEKIG